MKKTADLALLLLAGLLLPEALFAHGVEAYDISGDGALPAATVHFKYSTGEAMAFARIRLFAPSRPDTEVLSSLADRSGRFSFVPDEEGDWIVEASDNMGHQGSITINAAAEAEGAVPGNTGSTGGKIPLPLSLSLGLSLILNIFAFYSFVLQRIAKKRGAHAYQ
jgi:nickel transport protein